jgi:hypothetical protein
MSYYISEQWIKDLLGAVGRRDQDSNAFLSLYIPTESRQPPIIAVNPHYDPQRYHIAVFVKNYVKLIVLGCV